MTISVVIIKDRYLLNFTGFFYYTIRTYPTILVQLTLSIESNDGSTIELYEQN